MFVRIYIYYTIYINIYICLYIYICVCKNIYIYNIYKYLYMSIYMCVCKNIYILYNIYKYLYMSIYIYMCVCKNIYIYILYNIYKYLYMSIYIYMCVFVRIYIYIYINPLFAHNFKASHFHFSYPHLQRRHFAAACFTLRARRDTDGARVVVSAAFAAVMVGDLNGLGTRSRGLQGWWFGWGEVGDDGMMFSFFSYFFWGGSLGIGECSLGIGDF